MQESKVERKKVSRRTADEEFPEDEPDRARSFEHLCTVGRKRHTTY